MIFLASGETLSELELRVTEVTEYRLVPFEIYYLIITIIRDNTDTRSPNKLQLRPKNQPHLNVLKRTCFHPGVSGISITDIFLHPHLNVNVIRNGERLCWSSTSQTGDRDGHDEGDMEHGTK